MILLLGQRHSTRHLVSVQHDMRWQQVIAINYISNQQRQAMAVARTIASHSRVRKAPLSSNQISGKSISVCVISSSTHTTFSTPSPSPIPTMQERISLVFLTHPPPPGQVGANSHCSRCPPRKPASKASLQASICFFAIPTCLFHPSCPRGHGQHALCNNIQI
jgi:hypothetical protein